MAKVSILVPIFNVEKYLSECLDSLLNQTLKDIEIICINDGSTDSSKQILDEYAKKDSRIFIIDKANSGYGDSMNIGLKKATGEYIGVVESDDWVEPTMFEDMYALAKEHDVEVVKGNYFTYYTSAEKKYLSDQKIQLVLENETKTVINPLHNNHIFYQNPAIWAGLYNRKFLQENGIEFLPTPGASYQDTGFNFKVWACASRVFYTTNAYLHYRKDNEASSVNSVAKTFSIQEEYAEIERFLREKNKYEDLMHVYHKVKFQGYFWNINRLTPALAEEFINAINIEYKKHLENGEPIYEFYDPNTARIVKEIVSNPKLFIQRKYAKEKAIISIIMPVRDANDYLEKAINSVLSQTFKEFELVIIDCGSTDGSLRIIDKYLSLDPRIRMLHSNNTIPLLARNDGIFEANSNYITFIDPHDYYEKDAIESLYTSILENDVDIVVGQTTPENNYNTVVCDEQTINTQDLSICRKSGKYNIDSSIIKNFNYCPFAKIYKKDMIVRNDSFFFIEDIEDKFFTYFYMLLSEKVYFIDSSRHIYSCGLHKVSNSEKNILKDSADNRINIIDRGFKILQNKTLMDKYYKTFIVFYKDNFSKALEADSSKRALYKLETWLIQNEDKLSSYDLPLLQEILEVFPKNIKNRSKYNKLYRKIIRKFISVFQK
ncbi:glycosyltransferase [Actinomyces sp. zg-332]|uniref:glycosyltransferase family 2 protein n=1 Tax=Actinomyces sp. zg-332 TaxID=2708340 RepID=UPI0014212831|nr:glycosyltransferase family 2 protein [Actinomyces sp. zg-332]QPK94647.1 glycosyltransferase [Actinomyces sp. zg-332]